MKLILIILLGIVVLATNSLPANVQCITDMECELMFGGDDE